MTTFEIVDKAEETGINLDKARAVLKEITTPFETAVKPDIYRSLYACPESGAYITAFVHSRRLLTSRY